MDACRLCNASWGNFWPRSLGDITIDIDKVGFASTINMRKRTLVRSAYSFLNSNAIASFNSVLRVRITCAQRCHYYARTIRDCLSQSYAGLGGSPTVRVGPHRGRSGLSPLIDWQNKSSLALYRIWPNHRPFTSRRFKTMTTEIIGHSETIIRHCDFGTRKRASI